MLPLFLSSIRYYLLNYFEFITIFFQVNLIKLVPGMYCRCSKEFGAAASRSLLSDVLQLCCSKMDPAVLKNVFAYSIRLYKANVDESDTALSELLTPLFRRFFTNKKSKIAPVFLTMALQRNALILPSVLPVLLDATKSAASEFLRAEAFIFLEHALRLHIGSVCLNL